MASQELLDTRAVRLRNAHELAVSTVRERVLAVISAHWNAAPNLRDEDVAKLVARIAPQVEAGQLAIARLTSVYLAQQANLLRGVPVKPAPIAQGIANIRGVPSTEVYRRPAVTVYTALSKGYDFADAKGQGLERLLKMAATDMQLAKTTQAAASLKHSGATLYRRTLSGKENCGICELAAKHYYKTDGLAPIHDDCDCGVEELHSNDTAGLSLSQLKAVGAGSTRSLVFDDFADLPAKRTEKVLADGRIEDADGTIREANASDLAVSENSETGPTLHWAQHNFTTAADLPNA